MDPLEGLGIHDTHTQRAGHVRKLTELGRIRCPVLKSLRRRQLTHDASELRAPSTLENNTTPSIATYPPV